MNSLEYFIRTAYNTIAARAANKLRTHQLNDSIPTLNPEDQAEITSLLNKCTSSDIGLHRSMSIVGTSHGSSVSYIGVASNRWFTLGVFILRPGNRIPLHNHPQMFGALKVIHGSVRVTSYTVTRDLGNEVVAFQEPSVTLTPNSSPAVVSPIQGNIHEVEYVDSVSSPLKYAAFIDFLSPPYEEPEDLSYVPCEYFRIKSYGSSSDSGHDVGDKTVVTLVKCPSPREYSSVDAPYMGTSLQFIRELERLHPASQLSY